ncbi:MAG: response regulator [Deltaproteobacteria bacterium]|nr:response regulator [Deltaproteobacteria bacterium]
MVGGAKLKSSAGQENGGPIKSLVLLAEDNEATAELTRKMLELFGYRVTVAKNGVEAVAKAIAELPDVIVMDIHMPVMDGLQAASQIRNETTTQSIPILAATAKAMAGDKEKCLASGCNDYIAKPFTHGQLIASIKQLLNRPSEPR